MSKRPQSHSFTFCGWHSNERNMCLCFGERLPAWMCYNTVSFQNLEVLDPPQTLSHSKPECNTPELMKKKKPVTFLLSSLHGSGRCAAASCNVSTYQMTSLEFPFCRSNCCSINTTGRGTDSSTKRRRSHHCKSQQRRNICKGSGTARNTGW